MKHHLVSQDDLAFALDEETRCSREGGSDHAEKSKLPPLGQLIFRRAKFHGPGQVRCLALLTCISLATGAPFDKSYDLNLASPPSSNFAHEEAHEKQLATNYFVDNIIEAFLNSWASKLDPLRVQKFRLSFSKDFLGLQFNGEALIKNITLTGLSKIKRTQNATIGPDQNSGMLFADATVGIDKLFLTAYAEINFLGLVASSDVILSIDFIEVNVKGYLPNNSERPIIDSLTVTHLHGVDIELPSLGRAGSKMVDIIATIFITVFKGSIKRIIEENLLKVMYQAILKNRLNFF